jgi:hypothetical protein
MTMTSFDLSGEGRQPLVWWTRDEGWTDRGPSDLCGLLSGAFDPLHQGHMQLQAVASALLGGPVVFELAAVNADKPPLPEAEILRRCRQFEGRPVAVSTAATFVEKSRLFAGVTFVVGADTALRVVQPGFYGGSARAMDEALQQIAARRCRFLVAARVCGQRLLTLDDLELPPPHAGMFRAIPARMFRLDVSSTDLRRRSQVESHP